MRENDKTKAPGRLAAERDPELVALQRVARILTGLAPDARARVVAWLASRLEADRAAVAQAQARSDALVGSRKDPAP